MDDLADLGLTGHEPPIEYIDGWAVMHRDYLTGRVELALVEEGAGPGGSDIWRHRTIQECGAIVEDNAALRAIQDGRGWGDGLQHVATVPMNVWANRLMEPARQRDRAHLRRFLNDPDHAAFRTKSGKI